MQHIYYNWSFVHNKHVLLCAHTTFSRKAAVHKKWFALMPIVSKMWYVIKSRLCHHGGHLLPQRSHSCSKRSTMTIMDSFNLCLAILTIKTRGQRHWKESWPHLLQFKLQTHGTAGYLLTLHNMWLCCQSVIQKGRTFLETKIVHQRGKYLILFS